MSARAEIASRLRQRVTIEQPSESADGAGGTTRSWTTLATVWAELLPLRGAENLLAFQQQAELTHRVTLRYRDDVTTAMRLSYDSRVFNIRSTRNVEERDQLLELLVEEGVAT